MRRGIEGDGGSRQTECVEVCRVAVTPLAGEQHERVEEVGGKRRARLQSGPAAHGRQQKHAMRAGEPVDFESIRAGELINFQRAVRIVPAGLRSRPDRPASRWIVQRSR